MPLPSAVQSVPTPTDAPWWADTVGYQVYIRSFADSNGDGIGDLRGITDHLDHFSWLGVETVWITPFYPSPMADFGYDVADYCDVDPRFGTLTDFDALVSAAHARDIRVVVDLVPNHTSDQHPWFRAARAGRDDPHRGMYVFRDPAPGGGPPNNWRSHFGGPAWTLDPASGQYWLHLFLPEQPDLDWSHPAVAEEFRTILRFWLDRGVDGFRIDVAHSVVKDAGLRDNPILLDLDESASPRERFKAMRHDHDLDQPGVLEVYRDWRRITAPGDAVLLGEVYLDDADAVGRYVAGGDALDLSFFFPLLHTTWDAEALRAVLSAALAAGRGRFVWVHSSHDDARAPTRFGGGRRGRDRALALLTLTAFLPGPLFLYQGDELGLENGIVAPEHRSDPVAVRNTDPSDGRDPVRTPMPWDPAAANLGFSEGTPWLPVAPNHGPTDSVGGQRADSDSHLHRVRDLLAARRRLSVHRHGPPEWVDEGDGMLAFRRGSLLALTNAGEGRYTARMSPGSALAHHTGGASLVDSELTVAPDHTAVVTGEIRPT